MGDLPYRFCPFKPGVFVELYVPKKFLIQEKLETILNEGFNWSRVKKHFHDRGNQVMIRQMLKNASFATNYERRVGHMQRCYEGYSIYEVKGAFLDRKNRIVLSDASLVVRLMFSPRLEDVSRSYPEIAYDQLVVHLTRVFRMDREQRKKLRGPARRLVTWFDNWRDDVGLFVFGYLVFQLCVRLKNIKDAGLGELEKVLWVSSFWNLEINEVEVIRETESLSSK